MKVYGTVDLHLFLTLVRDGCVWSALRAGYFTPGEGAVGGVLRETTKNLSQSTRSPGLDFNRGPHEYIAEIWSIRMCRSILYLAECLTVYIQSASNIRQRTFCIWILYLYYIPHPRSWS